MTTIEAFSGLVGFIIIIVSIMAAILLFLLPFFVFKIRNQVVSIDRKMDVIIDLLVEGSGNSNADGFKKTWT